MCFCRKSKTGYALLSSTLRTGSLQISYGSIKRECLSCFFPLSYGNEVKNPGQPNQDVSKRGSEFEIQESGKTRPKKKD